MKLLSLLALLTLSACTLSFSNIHTVGQASDVVDEEQAASPSTSLEATIPLK